MLTSSTQQQMTAQTTPAQAQEAHAFLRVRAASLFGGDAAEVRLLRLEVLLSARGIHRGGPDLNHRVVQVRTGGPGQPDPPDRKQALLAGRFRRQGQIAAGNIEAEGDQLGAGALPGQHQGTSRVNRVSTVHMVPPKPEASAWLTVLGTWWLPARPMT